MLVRLVRLGYPYLRGLPVCEIDAVYRKGHNFFAVSFLQRMVDGGTQHGRRMR